MAAFIAVILIALAMQRFRLMPTTAPSGTSGIEVAPVGLPPTTFEPRSMPVFVRTVPAAPNTPVPTKTSRAIPRQAPTSGRSLGVQHWPPPEVVDRPAPTATSVVLLTIRSNPSGARVQVDLDAFEGETPFSVRLPAGPHGIRVSAQGYRSYIDGPRLIDRDTDLMIVLKPRS